MAAIPALLFLNGDNMKALISSLEQRETGYRVAQIVKDEDVFPVADKLFWVDCDDTIAADFVWYDPVDKTFKQFSNPIELPKFGSDHSVGSVL